MSILKIISENIRISAPKKERSPKWAKVRESWLLTHPTCAGCGESKKLEVHHIKPFHLDPDLELDPNNLITLCETASNGIVCHQNIGHNGDYRDYNPNVVDDASRMLERLGGGKS